MQITQLGGEHFSNSFAWAVWCIHTTQLCETAGGVNMFGCRSPLNVSLLQSSDVMHPYCMLPTCMLHLCAAFCTVYCCAGWQACVDSQAVCDCCIPRSIQHPAENLIWELRTFISCFACSACPVTNLTFQACVQLGTGVHIDKCVSLAGDVEGSSYL